MSSTRIARLALLLASLFSAGCETSDATEAVLVNQYPVAADGTAGSVAVYKAWWAVALFADAVAAGQESDPVRVVPGTDYAYALLAPGWDPDGGTTPNQLLPIRSASKLSVGRGDTLRIEISDTTTVGNCAAAQPLSQEAADFITERIFPGEFSEVTYDAATCTISGGAGGDAGAAGASDAEAGASGGGARLDGARVAGQAGSPSP
jgi:hypothetical protein